MSAPIFRLRPWLGLVALAAACESPRETRVARPEPGTVAGPSRPADDGPDSSDASGADGATAEIPTTRPERDLPAAWATAPPAAFEALVAEVSAAGSDFAWSPAARAALVEALGREDRVAVHAAVLFAHAHDPGSSEALLARLEVREARPEAAARSLDAGDVVAAAALETLPLDAERLARMTALVVGPEPHPDLEVRVEIARSALARGEDAVILFLLRVLRALTPAEAEDPPDWKRITTLAWAKSRAAEALAARAGEPASGFRPDASWEDQMRAADRLEALLAR